MHAVVGESVSGTFVVVSTDQRMVCLDAKSLDGTAMSVLYYRARMDMIA